jgi:hypothetical protein
MLRTTPDQPSISGAGQTFLITMQNEDKGDHQTENHVVVFEPGRAIGWAPGEPGEAPAGHTWVWRLVPDGGDTEVSQTYDWSEFTHVEALPYLPLLGREQLEESLVRLAEVIEGS